MDHISLEVDTLVQESERRFAGSERMSVEDADVKRGDEGGLDSVLTATNKQQHNADISSSHEAADPTPIEPISPIYELESRLLFLENTVRDLFIRS